MKVLGGEVYRSEAIVPVPLVTSPVIALPVTLLIRADELCAGQHMAFHSLLDFGSGRVPKIERGIERVELMEVALLPDVQALSI